MRDALEQLDRNDWDFASVSEGEAQFAAFYELCRESDTLRRAQECQAIGRGFGEFYYVFKGLDQQVPSSAGNFFALRQKGVLARSWQQLSEETKRAFSDTSSRSNPDAPTSQAAVGIVPLWRMWEMLDARRPFGEQRVDHSVIVPGKVTESGIEQGLEVYTYEHPEARLVRGGLEYVGLAIDWQRFSKAQISAAFKRLIEDLPAPQEVEPSQVRTPTARSTLERISVMRLLHIAPFKLCIQHCDALGVRLFNQEERAWYRGREDAIKTFRTTFPFLDEDPIHAPTFRSTQDCH